MQGKIKNDLNFTEMFEVILRDLYNKVELPEEVYPEDSLPEDSLPTCSVRK